MYTRNNPTIRPITAINHTQFASNQFEKLRTAIVAAGIC